MRLATLPFLSGDHCFARRGSELSNKKVRAKTHMFWHIFCSKLVKPQIYPRLGSTNIPLPLPVALDAGRT